MTFSQKSQQKPNTEEKASTGDPEQQLTAYTEIRSTTFGMVAWGDDDSSIGGWITSYLKADYLAKAFLGGKQAEELSQLNRSGKYEILALNSEEPIQTIPVSFRGQQDTDSPMILCHGGPFIRKTDLCFLFSSKGFQKRSQDDAWGMGDINCFILALENTLMDEQGGWNSDFLPCRSWHPRQVRDIYLSYRTQSSYSLFLLLGLVIGS